MAKKLTAESGLQLLARLSSRPSLSSLDNVLFPEDLQPGDIIQVSGASGAGKSSLLLHLLIKCLLPKWFKFWELGGLGVGVVLIDTDHNISILRLAFLLEQFVLNFSKLHSCGSNDQQITSHVEEIIKESMNRLIVLKTYSSIQLQMNFHSLRKILSSNSNVSLLMIDSLTSYYWQDTMCIKNYRKMDLYLKVMIGKLQKCIKDFKILTIFVKQEYFQSKNNDIKLPEISHKIDLRKNDKANDLFHAFIDSNQSSHTFLISDSGFTWVI